MSTPRSLSVPAGVRAHELRTARGTFAVLAAVPAHPAGNHLGTALLVPGFTGSKEDFLHVLVPLARAGLRVLAYDQRGQYQTPGPAGPEGWTMAGFAADVLAVADAVSSPTDTGPTHLLGHSFGGLVARAAVLADPPAFGSLVLMSSGPAALDQEQGDLLRRMADGIDSLGLEAIWAIKRAMDIESGWQPPDDPAVESFLQARFLANDPGCLAAMARQLAAEPDRTDELAEVLSRHGIPALVAFGAGDDAWSPEIQQKTASRLGATTVSFPEAAHSPAAESPEATAQALAQFWETVEKRG
jgi:pimeloyl-ACP methyl ester carboxylesterase